STSCPASSWILNMPLGNASTTSPSISIFSSFVATRGKDTAFGGRLLAIPIPRFGRGSAHKKPPAAQAPDGLEPCCRDVSVHLLPRPRSSAHPRGSRIPDAPRPWGSRVRARGGGFRGRGGGGDPDARGRLRARPRDRADLVLRRSV